MALRTAPAPVEQDTRLGILNTLLTTPHRKLEAVHPIHADMIKQDPLFYVRLGAWYNETGEIRDHKEMFIINLCLSSFEGHRDAGLAMLRELPPYELIRVVDFIHGKKLFKKEKPTKEGDKAKRVVTGEYGLGKTLPRSVVTEVERYLREREADPKWFDSTVVMARAAVKRLYSLLHIKPSDRAQQIVFADKPPEDSTAFAIKALANATTPADQAKAIIEHKIPYRIASSVVTAMTPTVIMALIEVMSPQELINNLGSLQKRGAMDNPDLKAIIEKKLEAAQTGKRVAALKGKEAIKAAGLSKDIEEKLEKVADAQVKAKGRIKRPTALLIDKSGSQEQSLAVGKQIAAMISAIADAPLYVWAFDTMPYTISPGIPLDGAELTLADWDRAFAGINAAGGTSIGCAVDGLIRRNELVEQLIIVSDGGENNTPSFADAYGRYRQKFNVAPSVCLVHIPGDTDALTGNCQRAGIELDRWEYRGDYYSLAGLIPLLTKGGKLDLLMEIMNWPIPKRRAS